MLAVLTPNFLPPPRLQVNRRACRFGPDKSPRRPHPPACASRVSAHPMLTYPHPPSTTAVRSTNRLRLRRSISGSLASATTIMGLPRVSFLGYNAWDGRLTPIIISELSLPTFPSSLLLSLSLCRSRVISFSSASILTLLYAAIFPFRSSFTYFTLLSPLP